MSGGGKKGGEIIVGYYYYLGWHAVLGHGPFDAITKIMFADRVAWQGSETGGAISINQPNLFGGDAREGGVSGTVAVLMGKADQAPNAYLQKVLGKANIPAFRGLCSLVFEQFYIGLNPYLKALAIQAIRTQIHNDGTPMWYAEKAQIGDDMNPAHMIRECFNDRTWGLGLPVEYIDDDSFTAAANTLFSENFGLSLIWDGERAISDVIEAFEKHIDGVTRTNLQTGKIELKLIRDDYDPATLPLLDESVIVSLDSFQRSTWEDTSNEITLIYHEEDSDQDKPITVQDIGNMHIQGRRNPRTVRMPAISHGNLAKRVAMREMRVASTPLAAIKITCTRAAWGLNKGDVFKFSWAKYGIVSDIYRVAEVDYGDLTSSKILITAVQDVFAFPASVYVTPHESEWNDGPSQPGQPVAQRVNEATYWDAVMKLSRAEFQQLDLDWAIVSTLAVLAEPDWYSYRITSRSGSAAFAAAGSGAFCPSALITQALPLAVASTVNYSAAIDIDLVQVGHYAYIEEEMVEVVSIDAVNEQLVLNRGVLDTVPAPHAAGVRIYFAENWQGFEITERVAGEAVDIKLLPVAPLGELPEASAISLPINLAGRAQKPYAPGNFKINGQRYPASISGDVTVTWSHRDRLLQTAGLIDQTMADIGPEPGTTYHFKAVNGAGDIIAERSGIHGTQYLIPADSLPTVGDQLRITVEAVNNGRHSWQKQELTVTVASSLPPSTSYCPDLDSFSVSVLANTDRHYAWSMASIPDDFYGVEVRYCLQSNRQNWEDMTLLTVFTSGGTSGDLHTPIASGDYYFAAKIKTTSGTYSANPQFAAVTLPAYSQPVTATDLLSVSDIAFAGVMKLVTSLRLPARSYNSMTAVLGTGDGTGTATLDVRKPDGTLITTLSASDVPIPVTSGAFTLSADTQVDIYLVCTGSDAAFVYDLQVNY